MDSLRPIPHTDLKVPPLCFGGNVFGWTLDEAQSFSVLDASMEAGLNFIDTADTYSWWVNGSGGQSETILGRWMASRRNRNQVILATKVGSQTKDHPIDVSRKHILASADASLKRLQTDHIDLYYTHFDDEKTPIEETLGAYDELVRAGKVRYIAASNVSPARLNQSQEVAEQRGFPRYVALQPHYNLLVRQSFESDLAPLVEKYDWGVFTYWSLEAGFLTGKYRSEADFAQTPRGEGIRKHFDARGKALLAVLDSVAQKHHTSPTSVALAWLLAKPLVTSPIVSARDKAQLDALVKAPTLRLDAEDMARLDAS